jgi:hypothetical protein
MSFLDSIKDVVKGEESPFLPPVLCADEGGKCTDIPPHAVLYYYKQGQLPLSGVARRSGYRNKNCDTPNFYNVDPARGSKKACAYIPDHGGEWKECAKEGGICAITKLSEVVYGRSPVLGDPLVQIHTTATPCTSDQFGADPAKDVVKTCWSRPAGPSTRWAWYELQFSKGNDGAAVTTAADHPEDIIELLQSPHAIKVINQLKIRQTIVQKLLDGPARDTLLPFIQQYPGDFDVTMGSWCSKNLDDPVCSCYRSLPDGSPAELIAVKSKPQCWSAGCNLYGYKNANLTADQSACSNITICTQNYKSLQNSGKINMDNVVSQDCSSGGKGAGGKGDGGKGDGGNEGGNDDIIPGLNNTVLYIIIVIVALLFIMATRQSEPPYPQMYPQRYW